MPEHLTHLLRLVNKMMLNCSLVTSLADWAPPQNAIINLKTAPKYFFKMSDEIKNGTTGRNGTDGFEEVLETFAWMFIDPLFKQESIIRELGVS